MPRCGVCGGRISLTVIPHAELCDDDRKAKPIQVIRQETEDEQDPGHMWRLPNFARPMRPQTNRASKQKEKVKWNF